MVIKSRGVTQTYAGAAPNFYSVPVAERGVTGVLSFAAGVVDAEEEEIPSLAGGGTSGVEDAVVVALLSSFGVELAVSMFFSPLTMDEPLGASVSPDPEVSAALSCAPRAERTALSYWVARRCNEFSAYQSRPARCKCANAYLWNFAAGRGDQRVRSDHPLSSSTVRSQPAERLSRGGNHHRDNIHAGTTRRSNRLGRKGCGFVLTAVQEAL
jgi:hypothetical protein